jgi:hypothetical protein
MLTLEDRAYRLPRTTIMFQSQTILDELLTRRHRSFLSQQIIFSYQILIDILYKVWGSNTEDYGRAIQIATGRRGDLGRSAQLFEGIFIDEPIEIEKLEESLKSVKIVERIPGDQKRPSPNFGRSNSLISSINFFAEKKDEQFILDRIGISKQKLLGIARCMWEIRACAFFLRTARNDDEHLDIQDFSVATAIAATGCAVRVSDCMQTIAWSLQGYAPSFNAMLAVPNDDCSQSLNEIMNQMLSPEAGTADAGSTKSGNDQATSIATLNALMTGQQGDTAEIVPVLLELLRGMNESKRHFFTVTQSLERIEGQGARIENCFIRQASDQGSLASAPLPSTSAGLGPNSIPPTKALPDHLSKREAEIALLGLRSYILFKMRITYPEFEPYHCISQRTAILQALHSRASTIEEYISVPVIKRIISMNENGRELVDQQLEDWGDQIAKILASVDYAKTNEDHDQHEIA